MQKRKVFKLNKLQYLYMGLVRLIVGTRDKDLIKKSKFKEFIDRKLYEIENILISVNKELGRLEKDTPFKRDIKITKKVINAFFHDTKKIGEHLHEILEKQRNAKPVRHELRKIVKYAISIIHELKYLERVKYPQKMQSLRKDTDNIEKTINEMAAQAQNMLSHHNDEYDNIIKGLTEYFRKLVDEEVRFGEEFISR